MRRRSKVRRIGRRVGALQEQVRRVFAFRKSSGRAKLLDRRATLFFFQVGIRCRDGSSDELRSHGTVRVLLYWADHR